MAVKEQLKSLHDTIGRLIFLCDILKQEKRLLQKQLQESELIIRELRASQQEAGVKYRTLLAAKSLAPAGEESKVARNTIDKLVREVDKCIALLSE